MADRIKKLQNLIGSGKVTVADARGVDSVGDARLVLGGIRPAATGVDVAAGTGSASVASAATALDPTDVGGEPAANVLSLTPLDLESPPEWDLPDVPATDVATPLAAADAGFDQLDTMIGELRDVNASRLRGEIPGDVADQIRRNSATSALAQGVGGNSPAARALQARDLGTTSYDIQTQALSTGATLTQLQGDLTKLRENRFQFMQQLEESRRTFREQSRQFGATLQQDQIRTQLAENELLLRQDMFNATQNMALVDMISRLTMAQTQLQVQAAASDINDSAVTSAYDSLITQVSALIKKSNPDEA